MIGNIAPAIVFTSGLFYSSYYLGFFLWIIFTLCLICMLGLKPRHLKTWWWNKDVDVAVCRKRVI